jgi:pyruvate formate lyase activating enzyme
MISRRECIKCLAAAAACGGALFADEKKGAHTAKYWHDLGSGAVQCDLCPHGCVLNSGKTGVCRGRQNKNGTLVSLGYGYPCAQHTDPIEKKPLYHFLPGCQAYSIAVAGCNLRCRNCQNYTISQVSPLETDVPYVSPQQIVDEAKKSGARVIAYTYSEPCVWIEYMYDTARLGRQAGLKNVMVTSGYINGEPVADLAPYIDGMHIDLKSFDEAVYRNLNAGKLRPVLDTICNAKKSGVWVEIINLIVPQWTDNLDMIRKMCIWIRENAGAETPLHFSRFFPLYQLAQLYPTPTETLVAARKIASEEKLKYVYVGNVPGIDANTYCPGCASLLVERDGYRVTVKGMKGAKCRKCGLKIPGIWETDI